MSPERTKEDALSRGSVGRDVESAPPETAAWAATARDAEGSAALARAGALMVLAAERGQARKSGMARGRLLGTVAAMVLVFVLGGMVWQAWRGVQAARLTEAACTLVRAGRSTAGSGAMVCGTAHDVLLGGAVDDEVIALRARFDAAPQPLDPAWLRGRVLVAWMADDPMEVVRLLAAAPGALVAEPSLVLDLAEALQRTGHEDEAAEVLRRAGLPTGTGSHRPAWVR